MLLPAGTTRRLNWFDFSSPAAKIPFLPVGRTTVIVIGTSGYYYKDWAGVFYPEGTKKQDMLPIYAQSFPAVELNFTYYGIPKPSSFERMLETTPESFEFVVKANRQMTHESKEEDVFAAFKDAIAPLAENGRLGAVLAQFQWAFKNTPANRNYLYMFREQLPGVPLVVEFRNDSWQKQEIFDFLKENEVSYCCVDEPVLPDLPDRRILFTAEPAYVRFHSRDAEKWYAKGGRDRYNYLYKEDELAEWVPKIKDLAKQAKKVYAFFNNCHAAQAAQNAKRLAELLGLR